MEKVRDAKDGEDKQAENNVSMVGPQLKIHLSIRSFSFCKKVRSLLFWDERWRYAFSNLEWSKEGARVLSPWEGNFYDKRIKIIS